MARGGRAREATSSRDCLPVDGVGLNADDFSQYIDYIADRRLDERRARAAAQRRASRTRCPWLAELMDIKKEQNFFEGRVTEYQKASSLALVADEEL